ncbi:MAG: hypothetical protein NC293_07650 [Roseburia sp.]|nr:hypothetical protein [Roseburia sp.]
MIKTYTYDSKKIKEYGKDRMRFELGDTMIEGGSDTTALTDEEIQAAVELYPGAWKKAKLMLLESICRRFAYEVDTKTGPLSLSLQDRAKMWRADYEALKQEVTLASASVPLSVCENHGGNAYFHTDMQKNERTVTG